LTKERWPDFFIVGAPRAGTRSIYEYLKDISGIFMPKIKEPNYFSQSFNSKQFLHGIRNKKHYLELFKDAKDDELMGEASPSYLRDPKAPKLIYEVNPNSKIIIILRDPVERAFSHYLFFLALGSETETFSKSIKKALDGTDDYSSRIISSGMYCQQVKRYFDTFGRDHVKILIFEEFVKDAQEAVKEILQFFGVKSDVPQSVGEVFNPYTSRGRVVRAILSNSLVRKLVKGLPTSIKPSLIRQLKVKKAQKPKMFENDRKLLENLYKDDAKKLEDLLGRKLPWGLLE